MPCTEPTSIRPSPSSSKKPRYSDKNRSLALLKASWCSVFLRNTPEYSSQLRFFIFSPKFPFSKGSQEKELLAFYAPLLIIVLLQKKQMPQLNPEDFYYSEEGFIVFTKQYHLKRGYCCQSGCKHCPYGFDKKTGKFKR